MYPYIFFFPLKTANWEYGNQGQPHNSRDPVQTGNAILFKMRAFQRPTAEHEAKSQAACGCIGCIPTKPALVVVPEMRQT